MVFDTRGSVIKDKDLSQLTWLRVGGPADFFFMPGGPLCFSGLSSSSGSYVFK